MQFQIMQQVEGRNFIPAISTRRKEPLVYNCPKKAAAIAARLSRLKGVRYQPRPVKVGGYEDRERARFANGEYSPVVWVKEKWWREIDGHFAHVAVKNPTMIAFTPDPAKGAADRQTSIAPGKYLQMFFGDKMTPQEIKMYALQHAAKYDCHDIKFATTAEEIQEVYKTKVGSCFDGTKANLYGSGDFAVAYLMEDGKVKARTVCAPERKKYVRIYPCDNAQLRGGLEKAGYERSSLQDDYSGLRLLAKWMWKGFYADWYDGGNIYGPYNPDPNDERYLLVP